MNIKEAKAEIIRTVHAYLRKDETGGWEIPPEQQRPILLIGPPGIGKTAVMEQIASECGIGLVSYTITHHTRQSAIGLPVIARRTYDGTEMSVTEYTMSEIVASVYEKMENTGVREGILFLDEINCVSETLAPTMLQFLQYKTFGTHRVPEGWLIVTAGNQPQYNRSARDFDVVTLDRVKKMEIEADYTVWREYAARAGIHGAILSYLGLKPQNFYIIRTETDGRHFVTARGWEDLSRMLTSYEKMGEPVSEIMVGQYLQEAAAAKDFALYYDLYCRYRDVYRIDGILEGAVPVEEAESLREIPFDEKYSLIRLLADALHRDFAVYSESLAVQEMLKDLILSHRAVLDAPPFAAVLGQIGEEFEETWRKRLQAGMIPRDKIRQYRLTGKAWSEFTALACAGKAPDSTFDLAVSWFGDREDLREKQNEKTGQHVSHAFRFVKEIYGAGQEMVMFLTELNTDPDALRYLADCGNPDYEENNRILLLHDRREHLRREILRLQ